TRPAYTILITIEATISSIASCGRNEPIRTVLTRGRSLAIELAISSSIASRTSSRTSSTAARTSSATSAGILTETAAGPNATKWDCAASLEGLEGGAGGAGGA